jgi:hypothetical protein
MNIQNHRREKLLKLLNGPMFKGDRGQFCEAASISKGRLSQLLDSDESFGDVAASNLATSLGLEVGYFNAFESIQVNRNDEGDVIVPSQCEVKAYLNQDGDIVLSRPLEDWERYSSDQETNVAIIIPKLFAPRLIEKLKELLAAAN